MFCSDGVFEAHDARRREFGVERLIAVIERARQQPAQELVDAIFGAVQDFRGETTASDDMTAVAIRITA